MSGLSLGELLGCFVGGLFIFGMILFDSGLKRMEETNKSRRQANEGWIWIEGGGGG